MSSAMITAISHIPYRVRDLDESIGFFTQKLGFRLLRKWLMDKRESAYLQLGDVLLEMSVVRDASELPADQLDRKLGLTVTNLDAVLEDLTRQGVKIGIEPFEARTFWGRQAGIFDPSGYIISLREWRSPDNPTFEGWEPTSTDVVRVA